MTPFCNGHTQPLSVSTKRIELAFKDDSRASLHQVLIQGGPDRYLRAVPHAAGEYIVDLRKLVPQLGDELCTVEPHDTEYHVFMTLRQHYANADAFMNAVLHHRSRAEESVGELH